MARTNVALYALNHGEISKQALGRVDVDRLRLAAETQVNWMPLTVGPAMLRPGLGYLGSTKSNAVTRLLPFVFATDDTAVLEFTNLVMRVWVDDELVTIPSVSTAVTNGDFSSSAGWTLTATSGASATISGGVLSLHAVALGSSSFCERSVTVSAPDQNIEHRLRIVVTRGPVTFQVGSTSNGTDYIGRSTLGTGTHSLVFTPTGNFYVRFSTLTKITKVVDSITVEAAGTLELPTPWITADLSLIRIAQSGDIVFVAADGYQQRQIERRDNNAWSIVLYEQTGGPYTSKPSWASSVRMTPTQVSGGTRIITSSAAYFNSNHLNSLIALDMSGQSRLEEFAGGDQYMEAFKIEGTDAVDRTFSVAITGTWVGTVRFQRSVNGPDVGFVDWTNTTSNLSQSVDDSATHANIEVWYRYGFNTGDYTSGVALVAIDTSCFGGRGQARIIGINSATEAAIEIFDTFDQNRGSLVWRVGEWSSEIGWPSAVVFHDGRLWWGGRDKVWGSVSDDFLDFDEQNVTDAGPINRSFGNGPFARVSWLISLQRLIAGRDSSCVSIRSSSFDAPLTPTDFTMRDCSSHGVANVSPVTVDSRAVYVDKSGRRVYELSYSVDSGDYKDRDLTRLNFDIGDEGFVDIAVQRQPDTRIHFVRGDGVAAVLTYDTDDEVEAWWRVETDGEIESVCVLPGQLEDAVYYVVKRVINGVTKRYVERFARMDEALGGTINKIADGFIEYSGVSTATITGLSHLEAKEVVVWGNGKDLGNYTVAAGSITISEAVTYAVIGLEYEARFTSAKLPYAAQMGSALTQKKKIDHIGLILTDTHYQGVEFGQSFDRMDPLPQVVEGATVPANTIWTAFDAPMFTLPGNWQTDARLCLRATAPRPACVNAVVIGITTHEKP